MLKGLTKFSPNSSKIYTSYFRTLQTSTSLSCESKYEFTPLQLRKKEMVRQEAPKTYKKAEVGEPREKSMSTEQDWPTVWPTARSFHPASVPLPLYMGYVKKDAPPYKYANAELMKIPNFLHLTPQAVERHCEALRKFCTPWPDGLETEEKCQKHFPVEVTTTDYCHASTTIRDQRARNVTVEFPISSLPLDYHANQKMIRLAGEDRYNPNTNTIKIVGDRCPLKKQNYDYIMYCLTALFFESWRVEPWEIYQTREDLLEYLWEDSSSMHRIVEVVKARRAATEKPAPDSYLARLSPETTPEEVLKLPEVQQYGKTFSTMVKEPFNYDAIEKYKETVLSLYELNQKPEPIEPQVSK